MNQLSWRVFILPFMEEQAIYDQMEQNNAFKYGEAYRGDNNAGWAYSGPPTPWGTSAPSSQSGLHRSQHFAAEYKIGPYLCPSTEYTTSAKSSSKLDDGRYCHVSHYIGVAGPLGDKPGMTQKYRQNPNFRGYNPAAPDLPLSRGGSSFEGLLLYHVQVKAKDCTDGLSKTLLIGESVDYWFASDTLNFVGGDAWVRGVGMGYTVRDYVPAAKNILLAINSPPPAESNNFPFNSRHPGGTHFATGDGAVTFVDENIDLALYKSLASRSGGELASLP
jgi:hypothetical protein